MLKAKLSKEKKEELQLELLDHIVTSGLMELAEDYNIDPHECELDVRLKWKLPDDPKQLAACFEHVWERAKNNYVDCCSDTWLTKYGITQTALAKWCEQLRGAAVIEFCKTITDAPDDFIEIQALFKESSDVLPSELKDGFQLDSL